MQLGPSIRKGKGKLMDIMKYRKLRLQAQFEIKPQSIQWVINAKALAEPRCCDPDGSATM
jgi:hypothetical protein